MLGNILSLISILVMMVMVALLIRQVNKPAPVNTGSIRIGLVMAPVLLVVNLIFLRQSNPNCYGLLLLAGGLAFGMLWGQTTRLIVQEGTVIARQSILHLVFWGISMTVTQLLAAFAPAAWVAGGLAMMFFSTGSTLGTNLNLLLREGRLKSEKIPEKPVVQPDTSPEVKKMPSYPTTLPK